MVYAKFFSGKKLTEERVFDQSITSMKVGPVTGTTKGDAKWNTPLSLTLDPKMNPIGINADVSYQKPNSRTTQRASYDAQLKLNDQVVWSENFSVSAKRKKDDSGSISIGGNSTVVGVKTFSVEEAGEYQLHIQPKGNTRLNVEHIDIKVRKNVSSPNLGILIGGWIAFALSIVGFIFVGKLQRPARSLQPAQ